MPPTRALAWSLAVVAALSMCAFVLLRDSTSSDAAEAPAAGPIESTAADPTLDMPAHTESGSPTATMPERSAAVPTETTPPEQGNPPVSPNPGTRKELVLSGTFTLVDAFGRADKNMDGEIFIRGTGVGRVAVHAGAWSVVLTPTDAERIVRSPSSYQVSSAWIGIAADNAMVRIVRPAGSLGLSELNGLEIVGRLEHVHILHVVDALSGDELANVEFAKADIHLPIRAESHPGFCYAERGLGSAPTSPVDVVVATRGHTTEFAWGQVLVRARGYAWTLAPKWTSEDDELSVSLVRSGELELAFEIDARITDASVELFNARVHGPPIFKCPWGKLASTRIDGLAPGTYSVRFWPAEGQPRAAVQRDTEVEVSPGELARATVTYAP